MSLWKIAKPPSACNTGRPLTASRSQEERSMAKQIVILSAAQVRQLVGGPAFIDNKYRDWYCSLVEKAIGRGMSDHRARRARVL